MKNLIKSLRLTIVFCVFISIGYVLVLWLFAQIASPNSGDAQVAKLDGKIVGAENVGQLFTKDIYFWGRPSAAGEDGYDASHSGGTNKAVTDTAYIRIIENRVDTFLLKHPYLTRNDVPSELVTASGSGLDPDITPQSAYIQVQRIANARGISIEEVKSIVDKCISRPLLGLFGPEKVNVLKMNIMLDSNCKVNKR